MRIERIRIDAFGKLRGLDTGERPLPGLVVVLGPNEAGKSTLFHFLTSMLYGFQPATRDGNPYSPWGGGDAEGGVSLRLDDGRGVAVERRLLSQPSARVVEQERVEDLRNRAVPWVEHVPRGVFRQVFALTLGELARLDGETWDRVQDRILGAMGATDLRPVRAVVAELEREAGELWRPTRRGNQRVRDIQERALALRERRRAAMERDRRLRETIAEGEVARRRLAEVRHERQKILVELDRLQELVPIRHQLHRISSLESEAGDLAELEGLPSDPAAALGTAEEKVQEARRRLTDLDAEGAAPRERLKALDDAARTLLGHREAIRGLLSRTGGADADRARLAALEQEIRDLERRLEGAASSVLGSGDARTQATRLAEVPIGELRQRVRTAAAAREHRRVLEAASARREGPAPAPGDGGAGLHLALVALGGVALVVGWLAGQPVATAVGGAVAAIGGAAWWAARRRRGEGGRATGTHSLDGARAAEAEAVSSVARLFEDVPLAPAVLAEPGEALTGTVERIRELSRDRNERLREADEIRERLTRLREDAERLARTAGVGAGADPGTVARRLEQGLAEAEAAGTRAEAARAELRRLERASGRVAEEISAAEGALDLLRRRLEAEGSGDAPRGAATLRERIEARDRAARLREELARAHPDLESLRARIADAEAAGESWVADADDLAHMKARAEELADLAQSLAASQKALERDAAHLREAETVDAIDGEAAALREEEERLVRERDRLWVLAAVLREADRRFREEHQPDLMRRAGAHLAALTGGRYDRIVADDGSSGDRFLIAGPGLAGPIALDPPISTGTLEQAYLSLRLAIVDHLDQGLERLPLFVDEVFVNWDRSRRNEGLAVLEALAERRQLFVFTCHETMAAELEERGGRVFRLGTGG